MTKKITSKNTLSEILDKKGAEQVLVKYNLPCLSCPMAQLEISSLKIGEVCKMYGLPLKEILKDLNSLK
jgi:hypothetical protein